MNREYYVMTCIAKLDVTDGSFCAYAAGQLAANQGLGQSRRQGNVYPPLLCELPVRGKDVHSPLTVYRQVGWLSTAPTVVVPLINSCCSVMYCQCVFVAVLPSAVPDEGIVISASDRYTR